MTPEPTAPETRAGFVAILGAPNVGKSTLLNRLVGTKVSIVSPKVQTTRRRIIGISMVDEAQILFVDTPGIFTARKRLERAMVQAAWAAAADADLCLFLVDARRGLDADSRTVLEGLETSRRAPILVVNKIDLVSHERLLPLVKSLNEALAFDATFLVSAETGDGCPALLAAAAERLPAGPWLYPEDQLSDLSNRALAAEITREKLFLQLHQELPYSITVETEAWAEAPDGAEIRIDQVIYVQRPSQKGIVLGKGGRQIKSIGEAARLELEQILEARVHLFLFVKVRERWQEDAERYGEMGLDFPD
ncbi:MAG: GTPase Era [Geminicoccaceae bacterium]|jgi:GTP-binding protein Era|nr:GTPase Era [Geminicoccaceae bacterium]HRY26703.1 GTPase Era [Geminicoccaceae bacterium]